MRRFTTIRSRKRISRKPSCRWRLNEGCSGDFPGRRRHSPKFRQSRAWPGRMAALLRGVEQSMFIPDEPDRSGSFLIDYLFFAVLSFSAPSAANLLWYIQSVWASSTVFVRVFFVSWPFEFFPLYLCASVSRLCRDWPRAAESRRSPLSLGIGNCFVEPTKSGRLMKNVDGGRQGELLWKVSGNDRDFPHVP